MENLYNFTTNTDLIIDPKNLEKLVIVYNTDVEELDYFVQTQTETAQIDDKTYKTYAKKVKTVECGITHNKKQIYSNYELCQEYHLETKKRYFHLNVNGNDFLTTKETYKILLKHRKTQTFSVKQKNLDFDVKATVEKMTRIYVVKQKFQKSYFCFGGKKFEITNEMYKYYLTTIENTESFLDLDNQIVAVNEDVINFCKTSDKKEEKQNQKLIDNNVISYYNYSKEEEELYIKDTIVDKTIVPVDDKIVKESILGVLKAELDTLSSEELQIIKALFVENITQTDLANKLQISQQTLNYRKKKILKNIYLKFSSKGIKNLNEYN